jgi:hypothetical protein
MLHARAAVPRPSAPLVLSSLACVLSACALIVALGAAPAGRPPAQVAEPAPLSNRVTISGLTISRGEIAPAAVDASALADAAVTSRAIADHSVTPSKLSEDAMRQITRAAAASISMVGEVDEAGGVVRGAGFSAQRASTGEYELAFDAPFVAPPVVVAVAQSCACGGAARESPRAAWPRGATSSADAPPVRVARGQTASAMCPPPPSPRRACASRWATSRAHAHVAGRPRPSPPPARSGVGVHVARASQCLSDLLGSAPSAANTRFSFVASATA